MVRDGLYYGLGAAVAAVLLGLINPWLALPPVLLGVFFLWFFRDPERAIPDGPGVVVSPADGKVTAVGEFIDQGQKKHRISIFLNVFNVHVNRAPIEGTITSLFYQKGKFGNAMSVGSSDANEQNIVTVNGDGQTVVFKQIAGLLARRIVFNPRIGDSWPRGIGAMNLRTPRRRADDPQQPYRMRRGMYILPSIFTAGNIAAGYYAISQAIQGSAL